MSSAFARTALAGNPSDGYGGAVLATTFADFRAEARARHASRAEITPPSDLVELTAARFIRSYVPGASPAAIGWRNEVPREVGLGSSSALVIATARALCEHYGVSLAPDALAQFAHAVERHDLGVPGGRQDQVVQSHEGLLLMEFGEQPSVERLDPSLLPPLLVAYRTDAAEHSGLAHAPLRARFEAGERLIHQAADELASLARTARDALRAGDHHRFAATLDSTFEIRARMMPLAPAHVAMIETARGCGASANYSGSGGAIVCACRDQRHRRECERALRAAGCLTCTLRRHAAPTDRAS